MRLGLERSGKTRAYIVTSNIAQVAVVVAAGSALFGLAAVAGRKQLILFPGFDLFIAGVVVFCGGGFCLIVDRRPTVRGVAIAGFMAIGMAAVLGGLWNSGIARLGRSHGHFGAALLLISLGAASSVGGLVGTIRGPGLLQPAISDE